MPARTPNPPSSPAASCADGQPGSLPLSPLQRLPTELKRQIISYVIPQGSTVMFTRRLPPAFWIRKSSWNIDTCGTDKVWEARDKRPERNVNPTPAQRAFMSLIRTSKDISMEARSMLYSENEFLLRTDMPVIGGRSGPIGPRLLRDIKIIRLVIEKNLYDSRGLSAHQSFLRNFTSCIINARGAGNDQMPLLEQLGIEVIITVERFGPKYDFKEGGLERRTYDSADGWGRTVRTLMYMLESFTALPPVNQVRVTGLPEWFAVCFQLCVRGRGGAILPLHWQSRRMKNSRKGAPRYKSERPDDAPSLDWGGFAERNKIELPDCMFELFKRHNARFPRPSPK